MNIDLYLYESIKNAGIDLIFSVPCILLKGLLKIIEEKSEIQHIPVTREEEGVGIAAGAYLGGRLPALLMQNSGLGNSINAIKSLIELYKIPAIFIISHRGTEGEKIIAQIPMGQLMSKLLDCIEIKKYFINSFEKIKEIRSAIEFSQSSKKSIAIILTRSLWSEKK
ncbi:MAG: sulfopyruvate decarboxylase subunit alpha [Promethearchaeota archaeon]